MLKILNKIKSWFTIPSYEDLYEQYDGLTIKEKNNAIKPISKKINKNAIPKFKR